MACNNIWFLLNTPGTFSYHKSDGVKKLALKTRTGQTIVVVCQLFTHNKHPKINEYIQSRVSVDLHTFVLV